MENDRGDAEKQLNELILQCHVIHEERNMLRTVNQAERVRSYRRLIFQYLYIKDFVYAKKVIEEYISEGYDEGGYYRFFTKGWRNYSSISGKNWRENAI